MQGERVKGKRVGSVQLTTVSSLDFSVSPLPAHPPEGVRKLSKREAGAPQFLVAALGGQS